MQNLRCKIGGVHIRTISTNKSGSRWSRVWLAFIHYSFFRLATPTKPIRPEPNSHTAEGMGTAAGLTR